MFDPKIDVAFWDYDRTKALADGSVKGVSAGVGVQSWYNACIPNDSQSPLSDW